MIILTKEAVIIKAQAKLEDIRGNKMVWKDWLRMKAEGVT